MQDVVKKVLGLIGTRGIHSADICLGDLIAEILFYNQAVLIDESRQVYLLQGKNGESEKGNNGGLQLTDLLAVLTDLENSHLLFVANDFKPVGISLFYSGVTSCNHGQFDGVYDIGSGKTLRIEEELSQICEDGNVLVEGGKLPKVLSERVIYYLTSVVYPTEGLRQYIARGYITEAERQAKRANTISVASVIIAILVAVSAPFISVWWSNTHGRTTIIENQYDHLIKTIGELKDSEKPPTPMDTIVRKDTLH